MFYMVPAPMKLTVQQEEVWGHWQVGQSTGKQNQSDLRRRQAVSYERPGCGATREEASSRDEGSTSSLRALGQRAFLPSALTGLLGGLSQFKHPQGLAYPKFSVNAGYDYFQAELMEPSHYPSAPSLGVVSDQLLEEFGSGKE